MTQQEIARHINCLAAFCGRRDIPALTPGALQESVSFSQADLLILFGGSIPSGCDEAARAMQAGAAKRLMLVGGEGHTTGSLRRHIHAACPEIPVDSRAEADIMADYLALRYGISGCLIERRSTNCGNNITYALALMREQGITPKSVILMQDATMQLRMDAGFRRYASPDICCINYASYRVTVQEQAGVLAYDHTPWGMWDLPRYLTLLMGEIPRLTDGPQGYGPRGQGFIAHVDIPPGVEESFSALNAAFEGVVRKANPLYQSRE